MTIGKTFRVATNPRKPAKKRRLAAKKKNAPSKHRRRATKAAQRRKTAPARKTKQRRAVNAMAKKASKSRRRAPSTTHHKRRKARNPSTRRSSHRRRRNPSAQIARAGSIATEALTALVALVATRQLPQMLLAEKNQGWIGYLANAAAAALSGFTANKFLGARAGAAAVIGGTCYLASRVLTEQLSPIGQYLSLTGVGDASAAMSLGNIEDSYFTSPTVYDEQGRPVIPQQIISAAQAGMMPQQQPAAMAGTDRYRSAYA